MVSKIIDHLDLVSGAWDELQISETIDGAIYSKQIAFRFFESFFFPILSL